MEKDAQRPQTSQSMQWNTAHLKQQTTHVATLFYQNLFLPDSWTASKEVLIDNQFWYHIKKQLPQDLFPLEKFINGLSSKHFVWNQTNAQAEYDLLSPTC